MARILITSVLRSFYPVRLKYINGLSKKPFKDVTLDSKIQRDKIIGKAYKKAVLKILYVDSSILILQHKRTEEINGKNKQVKIWTLYRRRT